MKTLDFKKIDKRFFALSRLAENQVRKECEMGLLRNVPPNECGIAKWKQAAINPRINISDLDKKDTGSAFVQGVVKAFGNLLKREKATKMSSWLVIPSPEPQHLKVGYVLTFDYV